MQQYSKTPVQHGSIAPAQQYTNAALQRCTEAAKQQYSERGREHEARSVHIVQRRLGKSTTLMAVASILAEKGVKIACFEADDNEPLSAWQEYGRQINTWDDNCRIFGALDVDQFGASYEEAEAAGCEIGLIDTRGGGPT